MHLKTDSNSIFFTKNVVGFWGLRTQTPPPEALLLDPTGAQLPNPQFCPPTLNDLTPPMLPFYHPDNHHCPDVFYWKGGALLQAQLPVIRKEFLQ